MTVIKQAIFAIWAMGCTTTPELAALQQAVTDDCPPWVCGFNAPGFDAEGFHSVSRSGRANEAGFRLVAFQKDGVQYRIDVTHGYLTGSRSARLPGPLTIAGQALVGAQLVFERDGESKLVRIARVGATTFPIGEHDAIETYVLEYSTIGTGGWRNLCAGVTLTSVVDPGPDALGMQPDEALLFEGDHIDLVSKTVAVEPDLDWFTIGCSGHVLTKLHLTRNTIASTSGTPAAATFAGRQATLKLLTADYCGDGTAFTVAGQPLIWLSFTGSPPGSTEAYWNAYGPLCLSTPRMAEPTTIEGPIAFPDIEAAISAHCTRPPPCNLPLYEAERQSMNPAPYY